MLNERDDATNNEPTTEVDKLQIGDVVVDSVESRMLTVH